jgi:hypothetical protein
MAQQPKKLSRKKPPETPRKGRGHQLSTFEEEGTATTSLQEEPQGGQTDRKAESFSFENKCRNLHKVVMFNQC